MLLEISFFTLKSTHMPRTHLLNDKEEGRYYRYINMQDINVTKIQSKF